MSKETTNTTPTTAVPQVAKRAQAPYKRLLQGIPVKPGETLQDVHPTVIKQWFNGIETRWKAQYNSRMVDGAAANMSWTRG